MPTVTITTITVNASRKKVGSADAHAQAGSTSSKSNEAHAPIPCTNIRTMRGAVDDNSKSCHVDSHHDVSLGTLPNTNSISAAPTLSSTSQTPAQRFEASLIAPALRRRHEVGSLRKLTPYHQPGTIDFSSNDYLGLSQSRHQQRIVEKELSSLPPHQRLVGSTGSRLLTGDSTYAQSLEQRLASIHRRPAAMLCNSGYDANLAVLSTLSRNATVIMDELNHNSLRMGIKLSEGYVLQSFRHNDVVDLDRKLQAASKHARDRRILIVVESVYSMDGDVAPLVEIFQLASQYQACVVVDEAHGFGVYGNTGTGMLEELGLEEHPALLATVYTFGKAAGCHGAVVCGSTMLKEYLYNYGRPIMYSTSMPVHSLVSIGCSYDTVTSHEGEMLRQKVKLLIKAFRHQMNSIIQRNQDLHIGVVKSSTPIQALLVPGNGRCVQFCNLVWRLSNRTILLYPIRSPTVPKGEERVRIIIHAHNTERELKALLSTIESTLAIMRDGSTIDNQNDPAPRRSKL